MICGLKNDPSAGASLRTIKIDPKKRRVFEKRLDTIAPSSPKLAIKK
jgi:hypothetical protein